jgi:hypothetical protein
VSPPSSDPIAIELPDDTGGVWRSADHAGRPVLLIFHRHQH